MRLVIPALAALLAFGAAGSAQAAEAPLAGSGLVLPSSVTVDYVKKGGKGRGHKMKAYKRGNAYGYYRGNRGRHLGWYKNGKAYGARRVYYRF